MEAVGSSSQELEQASKRQKLNVNEEEVCHESTKRVPLIYNDSRKKVILLGDSITQFSFSVDMGGWGASIADWYGRTADIVNRGFSGYNSRWIRQAIPFLFPGAESSTVDAKTSDNVVLVTIYLGANDAAASGTSQHVPVIEYKENLKSIIQHLTRLNPLTKYILITPAAVDSQVWPGRSSELAAEYAGAARQLGTEESIPVADLWKEPHCISLEDLCDGLHMGPGGNRKIFAAVSSLIRANYPELVPEDKEPNVPNMSLHYPHWSALGGKDEEATRKIIENWTW